MLNLLVGLIMALQLITPSHGVVLGTNNINTTLPRRKITNSFQPLLNSRSAFVLDMKTGKVLFQKNGYEKRSIASITKLMTAIVFLENNFDWNKNIKILDDDRLSGGKVALLPGDIVNLKYLFKATLIDSLNSGALALSRSSDLTQKEFIERMNSKALELGMRNTHFVEPSGINPKNQSTAMDVAILLKAAFKYDLIKDALTTKRYSFDVMGGKHYVITNTNKLLTGYLDIVGGKTGYIDEAGFCLANLVKDKQVPDGIIVVILGANSKEQRFQENKFLSQWVFDNWRWN